MRAGREIRDQALDRARHIDPVKRDRIEVLNEAIEQAQEAGAIESTALLKEQRRRLMRLTKNEKQVLSMVEEGRGFETRATGEAMRGRKFTLRALASKGLIVHNERGRLAELTESGREYLLRIENDRA